MPEFSSDKAILMFSGGQDSAICLAWALEKYQYVETIGFTYGQRHSAEIEARIEIRKKFTDFSSKWRSKLGDDHIIDLPALAKISETALTREVAIVMGKNGLPNSFVPGRNLLFISYAAALGYRRGIKNIIGGMCEADYSGYPDCRQNTISAMQEALILGIEVSYQVLTPLMEINKAQSWQLAYDIGGDELVEIINKYSHTCYLGNRDIFHDWGYGCGECFACELRKKGYKQWKQEKLK